MAVKVKIPLYLRERTSGQIMVEVDGATVHECIEALTRRYPALQSEILDPKGMLLLRWMIYINDDLATPSDELTHPVRDGDTLALVPLVSGG
jgi:molybdopterin converting factor small subunit